MEGASPRRFVWRPTVLGQVVQHRVGLAADEPLRLGHGHLPAHRMKTTLVSMGSPNSGGNWSGSPQSEWRGLVWFRQAVVYAASAILWTSPRKTRTVVSSGTSYLARNLLR